MSTRRITLASLALSAGMVLSACAGGGASDTVGAPAAAQPAAGGATVNLYAYAVPKPGYDKLIPAFQATDAGKGVQFQQSYGASGDQSRKVAAGAEADFVNFSVEPDITRLVDKLEERGLIERERPSDNRRMVLIGLTEKGRALLTELDERVRECHVRQLGHLSQDQLRQLIALLQSARRVHEEPGSHWMPAV